MYKTHTNEAQTSANLVKIRVAVDYPVPTKGDIIYVFGHEIKLTQDMKPRISFTWNEEKKRYEGEPMTTTDNRIVFAAGGYSWREGEAFTKV